MPELQSPDFDAIADGEGPVRAPPGAGGNTLPLRIMACMFQWQEPHRGQRASVGGGDRVQSTGHVKLSDKILPVIRRNVITRETSTPGDSARGSVFHPAQDEFFGLMFLVVYSSSKHARDHDFIDFDFVTLAFIDFVIL